jgi:hypothetical protein
MQARHANAVHPSLLDGWLPYYRAPLLVENLRLKDERDRLPIVRLSTDANA